MSSYIVEEQIGETTATSRSGSRNSESVFPDVNEVEGFFSLGGEQMMKDVLMFRISYICI